MDGSSSAVLRIGELSRRIGISKHLLRTWDPLAIAGAGATAEVADTIGARLLSGDPVTAAQQT